MQDLWHAGRREDAAAVIPDDFVRKSNHLGAPAKVKDRIRVYRDAGITTLRVNPDGDTLDERLANLGQFMELAKDAASEV